jgi:hypothetical protein
MLLHPLMLLRWTRECCSDAPEARYGQSSLSASLLRDCISSTFLFHDNLFSLPSFFTRVKNQILFWTVQVSSLRLQGSLQRRDQILLFTFFEERFPLIPLFPLLPTESFAFKSSYFSRIFSWTLFLSLLLLSVLFRLGLLFEDGFYWSVPLFFVKQEGKRGERSCTDCKLILSFISLCQSIS